jgi:hypothetical protein
LQHHNAGEMQGRDVVWRAGEDFAIRAFRLAEIALLMATDRVVETFIDRG